LIIRLRNHQPSQTAGRKSAKRRDLEIPWTKLPTKKRREILLPISSPKDRRLRPIRADARARVIAAIAQGRLWLDELTTSAGASTEQIAARDHCSVRKVNMVISLAFLAPDLVKAAIEGRRPRGIGMTRLSDLPAEWPLQRHALGLAAQ
jgi:site-specific DNA recombinase